MASGTDKYANVLTESIEMSAADTLSFEEVNIGLSLFDKAGILISRIEYHLATGVPGYMTAAADRVNMGVTASNSVTSLAVTQQAVIHTMQVQRNDFGTAASASLFVLPIVYDFSTLPGGGLMITPKPWYIAMTSSGLASAASGYIRFFFTVQKLSPQDYFELMETRAYFG